jgi:hypothetical protein
MTLKMGLENYLTAQVEKFDRITLQRRAGTINKIMA